MKFQKSMLVCCQAIGAWVLMENSSGAGSEGSTRKSGSDLDNGVKIRFRDLIRLIEPLDVP